MIRTTGDTIRLAIYDRLADDSTIPLDVDCSSINIYPNWVSQDYSGGPYTHNDAGESMQYER